MIQVLNRAFNILEIIRRNSSCRLGNIAREAALNLTTAENIVVTLKKLGYIEKNGQNEYTLSEKLFTLASASNNNSEIIKIFRRNIESLSGNTGETSIAAVLHNRERYTIAEFAQVSAINVSESVYKDRYLFNTITGRILFAFAGAEEQKNILRQYFKNPASGLETKIMKLCQKIKKNKISILKKKEIMAAGAPVFLNDRCCAAIGVYMPKSRYYKKPDGMLSSELDIIARRIENEILIGRFNINDFKPDKINLKRSIT